MKLLGWNTSWGFILSHGSTACEVSVEKMMEGTRLKDAELQGANSVDFPRTEVARVLEGEIDSISTMLESQNGIFHTMCGQRVSMHDVVELQEYDIVARGRGEVCIASEVYELN